MWNGACQKAPGSPAVEKRPKSAADPSAWQTTLKITTWRTKRLKDQSSGIGNSARVISSCRRLMRRPMAMRTNEPKAM